MKSKFQRRKTSLPPGAIVALASGHDFFGAFGGEPRLTQRTLDKMRAAWRDKDTRQAVEQRQLDRWGTPVSFAAIAFGPTAGKRLKPNQVERVREDYQKRVWDQSNVTARRDVEHTSDAARPQE